MLQGYSFDETIDKTTINKSNWLMHTKQSGVDRCFTDFHGAVKNKTNGLQSYSSGFYSTARMHMLHTAANSTAAMANDLPKLGSIFIDRAAPCLVRIVCISLHGLI